MAETHDSVIRVNVQTDVADKFAKMRQETAKLDADMKRLKKSTNNLTTATKEEAAAYNQMRTQLLANKNALHDMERATLKANNAFKKNSGFVAGIRKGMLSAAKSMVGVTVAFMAIRKAVVGTFSTLKDFDKNLAELSAITGATGEDLEFYANAAKRVGETTRTSAIDFVSAVKLMGSAKPELLQNKEALVEVTEAAVTLAEASGMELTEATSNMASAMNSFSLPAGEAERVMNLLAAASQKGAKEVPYVTEALNKFGTTAAQAGISIEESVAAVETLGKVTPEAGVAGTQLRNIMIQMKIAASEQGREMTSLTDELERLAPEIDDVAGLTKEFGKRNLGAVQHLIKNRDTLKTLQKEITGTSTAYEQAATNADTLEGAQDRLGNALEGLALGASDLTGYLKNIVNALADFLFAIQKLPKFIEENRVAIIGLGVALVGLKLGTMASSVSGLANIFKVKLFRAIITSKNAMMLFNGVLTMNPIGLVVTAIGGLIMALTYLYNNSEKARAIMHGLFEFLKYYVFNTLPTIVEAWMNFGRLLGSLFTFDLDEIGQAFDNLTATFTNYGEGLANSVIDGYNGQIENSERASIPPPVFDAPTGAELDAMSEMIGPYAQDTANAIQDATNDAFSMVDNSAAATKTAKKTVKALTDAEKRALESARAKRQAAYQKAADEVVAINTEMLMLAEDLSNNAIADEWERKLAIHRTGQEREMAELQAHLDRLLQIQQQYSDVTSQHYIDAAAEIELVRGNMAMLESNHLIEIQDMTTDHNETMQEEQSEMLEQTQDDQEQLQQARMQSTQQILQQYHQLFGDIAALFEEGTREHAAFALAQIAIDTAIAISSLVAASEANPLNAVSFGAAGIAQFLSGLVRIFANIMQARQIIRGIGEGGGGSDGGGSDGGGLNNPSGAATIPDISYYVSPHEEGGIVGEYAKGGVVYDNEIKKYVYSDGGELMNYDKKRKIYNNFVQEDEVYAKGGMVYGKPHSQGGERFNAGGRVVELEGGEAVINKKNTAKFRPILSAINSYGGNGVKFAEGGMTSVFNTMEQIQQGQGNMLQEVISSMGESFAVSMQHQKVIVTESDISNAQNNVRQIETMTTF